MNDDQMRGVFRASEVIRAYEATWEGEHLEHALRSECAHAGRVAMNQKLDRYTHDEWVARFKMYRAALRRLGDKAVLHVA